MMLLQYYFLIFFIKHICCGYTFELPQLGHVERSSGAIKTAFDIQFDGKRGPGRPKMTWKQLIERIAESGSSWLSTLMIDIPGDLV